VPSIVVFKIFPSSSLLHAYRGGHITLINIRYVIAMFFYFNDVSPKSISYFRIKYIQTSFTDINQQYSCNNDFDSAYVRVCMHSFKVCVDTVRERMYSTRVRRQQSTVPLVCDCRKRKYCLSR